ncbi:MAG: carboxylating nicotinate-nucleotide diphosphorylase [Dehalococcoidia bacterium]
MLHTSPEVVSLIERALAEDQAFNDPTTGSLVPPELSGVAMVRTKASGVLAGLAVALAVFRRVDAALTTEALVEDGTAIGPGDDLAHIQGSVASILRAERTALNFLQRLSGIATETSRYVQAVQGLKARIVDTRKTVPGLRLLDKYAVRVGGGQNHRLHLADGVLIKDNHIAALRAQGLSLREVVQRALERAPRTLKVEVEVTSVEEAREALEAGAQVILLDNMPLAEIRRVVELVGGRAPIEASGGVNLETVRAVAETGVDLISVGALTHSVRALDISLELVQTS